MCDIEEVSTIILFKFSQMITQYYFKGNQISHWAFLNLCHRYGVIARRDESHFEAIARLAARGCSGAKYLQQVVDAKEVPF